MDADKLRELRAEAERLVRLPYLQMLPLNPSAVVALLAALDAERAARVAAEAERDEKQRTYEDLYADALADAKSDAQDFDFDLWISVRQYLTDLELDWRDYAEDGITADEAVQYIRDCMDEETARADAAETEVARLTKALHDAINRPKGVVPASAEPFYDPARYASESGAKRAKAGE